MNGIIDKQTSGNEWGRPTRAMLHERLENAVSPSPSKEVQQLVIEDLERQISEHNSEFADTLDSLKHLYVFTNATEVEGFLKLNRTVAPILVEAEKHLRLAFPKSSLLLEVMIEEGAPRTIYALALWNGEPKAARAALDSFDEKWWFPNAKKAGGKIVFDYEFAK